MALIKGICKNFGECDLADNKEVQEVDKINFVCEECGKPLHPIEGGGIGPKKTDPGKKKLIAIIGGAVVALAAIGGGIYALTGGGGGEDEGKKTGEDTPKVQLALNHTSKTMKVGESDTLVATVTPEGTQATFVWKASNKSNAVAVADGIVTAKEEGESKVQVKAIVGADTLSTICAYTVEKAAKPNPEPRTEPRPQPQAKPWASYATFDGTTMTFTKRHVIPGTDQIANPGDKVTGKWIDGEVNLVRWYHDGTSEPLTHK